MPDPTVSDFDVTELYDVPRVEIRSAIDPLSLQASDDRKKASQRALSAAVRDATRGVFTHDVEVTLNWYIAAERRYQTHIVADLDNVMKPMLDALTGPDGVLIDDNQVQSIKACWMTPGSLGNGFELSLEPLTKGEYVERAGLSFVEFAADRCYILAGGLGAHAASAVSAYRTKVLAYQEQLAVGIADEVARLVLPSARPFPRARLGRFQVRLEEEFPQPT